MAGRIREEDIALVREKSPIHEVIGDYLQLRNAGGGDLKGLCPFHDEKSPSFNVTPSRGLFYCFGCQESGDVISFVQKIEHLSFAEAVERLAQRSGVALAYVQGGYVPAQEQGRRTRLVEAHRVAAEFYQGMLDSPEAAPARRFLAERGFERAHAEQYGVGYAPAGWEALVGHLRSRGFADAELTLGGLAKQGRRGPIDRFRGRLVWPIRDLAGEVTGFGARRLGADDDGPKYLNSPETPLFKKGAVLYGADLAKREIARRRQAVVVEGYTDVMACHLAGVTTAVATCGTSFGDEHIKILRRLLMDQDEFRGEVIFTFDGDAAGRRAALRAFGDERKFVTQTFVAVQPDGLDPCDLRLKHGDAAVRDLVARRVPLFEFGIRSVLEEHNLETTEGRLAALDAAAPLVAAIKDRGLRDRYAVNLDRWLGFLDEQFVLARVREHARGRDGGGERGNGTRAPRRDRRAAEADPAALVVEREALKLAVQRPALVGPAFDALGAGVFTDPGHAAVAEVIAAAGGAGAAGRPQEWVGRLRAAASGEVLDLITKLAVAPPEVSNADGEPDGRYAQALLGRLEELALTRQITALKRRVERLNPVDQQVEYNRAFGELIGLEQRSRVLRERMIGGP